MQSLMILSGDLRDRVTSIAWSGVLAGLPAANLLDQRPRKVARNAAPEAQINIGWDAAVQWDTLLLINTNLGPDATIRIRTADTQIDIGSATGDDDSGEISAWTSAGRPDESLYPLDITDPRYEGLPVLYRSPTVRDRAWIGITIDQNDDEAFIEIGTVIPCMAFQPIRNAVYPAGLGFVPTDIQDRAPSGAMNYGTRARPRFQEIVLPNLRKDEAYGDLYELYRLRGQSKDIAIVRDPDETTHLHRLITHGLFAGEPKITHRRRERYQAQIRVEEFY